MDRMTMYSGDEIREMLGPDYSCRYYDIDKMEKRRTGSHRYFPAPDSGWLSCAIAALDELPSATREISES